jgi:RNA polymerase sigma-70 factor (ECF subfamily)
MMKSTMCQRESQSPNERPSAARFPTTHWSRVLLAGDAGAPDSRAALEELCRDYWYPIYAFVRKRGHDPETAQDLVQGLFAELLARDDLRGLDPSRGRFRTFLMACCSHYLAKHQEREHALKRGSGRAPISIDALAAETRFGAEPAHEQTAERLYQRRWALTLLDHVLAGLDAEMSRPDRKRLYEQLRPGLLGHQEARSHHEIGADLGLTEGAVKMAAHRLRARYRERLREEIGRTVADPAEVDAEIRELMNALAQ